MKKFRAWKCPGCGHFVNDLDFKAARFNYRCPGCSQHVLSEFNLVEVKKLRG